MIPDLILPGILYRSIATHKHKQQAAGWLWLKLRLKIKLKLSGATCTRCRGRGCRDPPIYLLSMLSVLQVDLKIPDCHFGSRGVEFPGAVVTSYPREVHPFDSFWGWLAWGRRWTRHFCGGVDCGVAHDSFETIAWVLRLKSCEAGC